MSMGVAFPLQGRRLIRGMSNPLDKSTIVSIYPNVVDEVKPTLFPGAWTIPSGTYEKPSVLTIGPSSWFRDFDEQSPIVEIPVSSIQIAESLIKDYCNGAIECDMGERMPGLFFLPGELSVEEVKKNHKPRLDAANIRQKNWFARLVRLADALYSKSNGNPLVVSDIMRIAANELGLQDKVWLSTFVSAALVKCVACGSLRDPNFPICQSCKTIVDPEKAKTLNLVFAK